MANRMTTYGYGYIDGKLSVIESEAEIVRRVFKEYCNGAILSEIGQSLTREGVEYYMGCTQWNKNRIKRVIENEKYIGADGYPQIVDEDEFVYANKLKDNRGRPQAIRHSSEVETARDIVYCGQCGRIMGRRSKWRSREKWLCPNGCKQDIYIADSEIFGGLQYVFNKVNAHPELLNGEETDDCYNQTMDVLRLNNDIHRLLDSKEPNFEEGKNLIIKCAALKFQECTDDPRRVYSSKVLTEMQHFAETQVLDSDLIRKVVEKVIVNKTGEIVVQFINGSKVSSREEVDTYGGDNAEADN